MKKQYTLICIIVIVFILGFLAGCWYTGNKNQQESRSIDQASESTKKPIQKVKPKINAAQKKVLIGYVQDFRDPKVVDYSKLTHVIFSFAHPAKNGSVLFNGNWALSNLKLMVSNAHKHKAKAILAIGGWYHIQGGESYPYFKAAISSPNSRKKLVNELIKLAQKEKLDGIDIDFEHPRSLQDARNLSLFAKMLSNKLHAEDKELSIAVNSKIHSVAGTEISSVVYDTSMFKYMDHVNIMAYDGQWDGKYDAANLSPYPYTVNIVNYWARLFDENKLSKQKLVLGVPLYAQPTDPAIKQISYSAIINRNPGYAGHDTVKMNGTRYYYNGSRTVQKKTRLAIDHGFGGMMLWEAGLDAAGNSSLTGAMSKVLEKSTVQTTRYAANIKN
jgi:chitinase